jgi:hypothetical protein
MRAERDRLLIEAADIGEDLCRRLVRLFSEEELHHTKVHVPVESQSARSTMEPVIGGSSLADQADAAGRAVPRG